ncbi:aminopeptidase [Sporosarcina globispora]|uniref:Aminopeptidase n=1 Tax=Sporosarcina globispora TaxID=1459 RepID=A0A0M0GAT4_SPOGL|nr:M28 family peptidase [Sporosarcina globispora]KON86536.1 aminopeptidase [Sporosarcina globispora]
MKVRKKASSIMLAAVLTASSLYAVPGQFVRTAEAAEIKAGNPDSNAFDQKVIARVDAARMMEDVSYLSETIGPRVAGTEAEKQAADFIRKRLESYGYTVETQEFGIPDKMIGDLHTSDQQGVLITIPSGSGLTPEEGITSELFDGGLGRVSDFTEDAAGKIALISRGEFTFAEKVTNAVNAGAAGVLIYNNVDQPAPSNPSIGGPYDIPVGSITKASGEALLKDVAAQNKTVTLTVKSFKNIKSQNIIATKHPKPNKGGETDIVHISAHFDSVPFAPGASDNASGTAVALELARVLKSYPADKELRFAFVGAEEIGLLGSEYYVSQLSGNDIERSIANFNMDMVGTAWENATAIYMNTLDGKANIVTETALATAGRIGTPSELVLYQRGASDHVSFHDAGIPAVNFIRREPVTANLEPYYHTPLDSIEHISADRMKEAGDLIGASVYSLIRK